MLIVTGTRAKPSRSALMIERLRGTYLYCEKRARDLVFDAAEHILDPANQRSVLLNRLRKSCAERARADAMKSEYVFTNWTVGTRTTLNAMLQAGVFLTHGGRVVPADITSESVQLVALRPDFRDRTESFLLEFLIRELGDVSIRDHCALAHALFRQFDANIAMEAMEDRVAALLASLSDTVILQANGTYVPYDRA